MKIKATIIGEKITSNTIEAINLQASQQFGEKIREKIFYSLTEAFYLLEEGKLDLFNHQDKKLSKKEIESKFQRLDKQFKNNYLVFKDLRKKSYVVKSALKFGATFRVYDKGKKAGKSHSKWLCFPIQESKTLKWQDFVAKNRVAHSTKKNLLIAVVDEECSVSYFEVQWTRP